MSGPLTKESLGEALAIIFPGVPFLRNRPVANLKSRVRPHYHAPDLRLVVQFDDPRHYTQPIRIVRDEEENRFFMQHDYEIVHIPYFVQLSSEVIARLFGTTCSYKQQYPHGFVHRNTVLPAAFCCLGIERFVGDLERFSFIREEILKSLEQKVALIKNERLVYPAGGKEGLLARLFARERSVSLPER